MRRRVRVKGQVHPLDASGNALGPFAVAQVVKGITKVSSSGTRKTAVRTITIGEPIT